jgi:outer membrane protein assembly factor BamB
MTDAALHKFSSDGAMIWSYRTGEGSHTSPAIGSTGTVYFGSRDNALYAVDSAGELVWSYRTGDDAESSPAIACDGRVLFGSTDDNLYCLAEPTPTPTATPPIDLTAQKVEFSTTDRIEVGADVWPLPVPCYPFVRIVMADGTVQYYVAGVGFTIDPTPYLGFEAGAITVPFAILGYPVLAADFAGIPAGAYVLEGGAVDAVQTTSADNLIYFGGVDQEPLTVR